ncbi:MAG TPA: hypothetical protein VLX91_03530 [Candidatus Acidoferrales bacterium]|nr:hypothetical protein [Candidatus Acidoferrales bacterium]
MNSQEKVRQSKRRSQPYPTKVIEAFFNQTIVCLSILDTRYRIVRLDEMLVAEIGKDVRNCIGKRFLDFFSTYENELIVTKEFLDEAIRTRKPVQVTPRPHFSANRAENGVTYYDWMVQPILDRKGRVEFLLVSFPMLVCELSSLIILAVNNAFAAHYGYSKDEALSLHLTDLYPDTEKKNIIDLVKILDGHVYAGEDVAQ